MRFQSPNLHPVTPSPQDVLQQRHADEDAVVGLAEVGGAGIGVDLGGDLVDAGQWVEQDGVRVEASHGGGVDDVLAAGGFVLLDGGEPFLLDSRLVDDVDVGQDGVEVRLVAEGDAGACELGADIVAHRHGGRGDEDELGAFGLAEQSGERARGAAEAQVADEGDAQPVDAAELVADGVEIEQRLGRVLAGAVAGVEDGNGGDGGRAVGRPLLVVADDDGVGVALDDADRVFDRLALDGGRELAGILGRDDIAAEPVHGRLEREPGAGRWFVEDGRQGVAGQRRGAARQVAHAIGRGEEPLESRPVELRHLDDVADFRGMLVVSSAPSRLASIVPTDTFLGRDGGDDAPGMGRGQGPLSNLIELVPGVWVIPGGVNIGVLAADDGRVVLVDTGLNDSSAKKALKVVREELGGEVVAMLTTHAHADHFGGNATVVKRTGAVVHAPAIDEAFLRYPLLQPALLFGGADPLDSLRGGFLLADASPVDAVVRPGAYEVAGVDVEAVPLFGHSPGQLGYVVGDVFFCADVVLPESVLDRYRIPYLFSLTDHLAALERARAVPHRVAVPGHGAVLEAGALDALIDLNVSLAMRVADAVSS